MTYGGHYRSLFEDLPPFQANEDALHELGRPGGLCDLGVDFVDDADAHISAVPRPGSQLSRPQGQPGGRLRRGPGRSPYGWAGETPLCFYILREAEVLHDGDRLGPVGGRIVGEVLVEIIDADPESFTSVDPNWMPTLPARRAGAYGLADILIPVE